MTTIDATVAELMRLATEYALAMEENCKYRVASFTQTAQYKAEQALKAALRTALTTAAGGDAKDAERYRWLMSNCGFGTSKNGTTELNVCFYVCEPDNIGDLDAAIDAAIQQSKKHNHE